jgi:tetratricopeptide (TPR) repeat protein
MDECALDARAQFPHRKAVDQLSAHLDRGWDLAQRGDAQGASLCARRALELDPQSPEVFNLLGYAAALQGESDEALEHYRQAIALDETYFEAMLNAAELLIPLGEFDEAINMCNDALDLAESDEETCDCLLLRMDAELSRGDDRAAQKTLARIPAGPYSNPVHSFLVGRARYELGDHKAARPLIRDAVARAPENADAHYYDALLHDEAGDLEQAVQSFLRTRELDVQRPPAPWALDRDAFEQLVRSTMQTLPEAMRLRFAGAPVYCVDAPGAEVVVDGVDPRQALLIETQEDRVRVFVYQRCLERLVTNPDDLRTELLHAFEREFSAMLGGRETATSELN